MELCRYDDCANLCRAGYFYCDETHLELNRLLENKDQVSLVEWPAGVYIARPPHMKVFCQKADEEVRALCTNMPQLPDPDYIGAEMPEVYRKKLLELQVIEHPTNVERVELSILMRIQQCYNKARDLQIGPEDVEEMNRRQTRVNDYFRQKNG